MMESSYENIGVTVMAVLEVVERGVITKLPNTEQSSKGRVKTHKSINKQNQSTTGKLVKPQCPIILKVFYIC
jgi:ribosomal protein L19E